MKGKYLIIIDTFGKVSEISLEEFGKSRVSFGRSSAENDIVIPSPVVSSHHGKFKIENDTLLFADVGSTNGTILEADGFRRFYRGNRQYVQVKSGNMLRIQPQSGETADNSILILYANSVGEGNWQRFPLLAATTKIGRDRSNDIVLSHPAVSRFHASLIRTEKGFVLVDENSSNGIFINGRKVNQQQRLREKDTINIANHILIYSKGLIFYKNAVQGINIEISDVSKEVGKGKRILNNVSATIESNEFVAIIGGSGAGKTTLMNAISGFDPKYTGLVQFNGVDVKAQFSILKNYIGYVPQEDIIYENLTLRKMLYYTAKLKMPGDISKDEINKRIDDVLATVELSEHQNTYIRKLSGGQKKRASIAVELLADPSVFFLDEPTSGLDPGTEQKLMITLNKLSKTGKTIIMVTHTTQSLELCDRVLFMGRGGNLCFSGTPGEARMFFGTDNLVDVYNMTTDEPEMWAEQFRRVSDDGSSSNNNTQEVPGPKKKSPALSQLGILIRRYFELIRNDMQRLLLLFVQPVFIAMLLALVSNEKVFYLYDDTKSILFSLSCAGIWIGLFNSIQEICKERAILKREYMSNLRLPLYTASKFFVQTVLGLLQALLMVLIFTLMVGQPIQGVLFSNPFWENVITVWFTIEASMAIGFVVSALVKNADRAMALAPFVLIIQLLFSGILFKLEGLGNTISYVTVSKWSVEALGITSVLNDLPRNIQKTLPTAALVPEEIFEAVPAHLLLTWGIMLGMTLLCAILCTFLLKRVSKDGR